MIIIKFFAGLIGLVFLLGTLMLGLLGYAVYDMASTSYDYEQPATDPSVLLADGWEPVHYESFRDNLLQVGRAGHRCLDGAEDAGPSSWQVARRCHNEVARCAEVSVLAATMSEGPEEMANCIRVLDSIGS